MSSISSELADDSLLPLPPSVAAGIAVAQAQADRGLLIHRLELAEGRVYDYHIVAPTE